MIIGQGGEPRSLIEQFEIQTELDTKVSIIELR